MNEASWHDGSSAEFRDPVLIMANMDLEGGAFAGSESRRRAGRGPQLLDWPDAAQVVDSPEAKGDDGGAPRRHGRLRRKSSFYRDVAAKMVSKPVLVRYSSSELEGQHEPGIGMLSFDWRGALFVAGRSDAFLLLSQGLRGDRVALISVIEGQMQRLSLCLVLLDLLLCNVAELLPDSTWADWAALAASARR